jgi:translocation and assembly module TamB
VPVFVDADFALAGRIDAWKASGHAELLRDKERAKLQLQASGDDKHATFDTLKAGMPTGTLDAGGDVTWAPQLAWKAKATLAGFDPGYFAPAWKGNLSGRLASEGRQRPPRSDGGSAGYDASFALDALSGQLRGRRVAGKADVQLQGTQGKGQLELGIGKSTIKAGGSVGDRLDLSARLQPLYLDDLLPGASGHLQGTLDLAGTREAPTLAAALDGNGLTWDGYAADRIGLHGKLPWRGTGGQLHLQGSGLTAGMALQSLDVDAEGAVENLRLRRGPRPTCCSWHCRAARTRPARAGAVRWTRWA